MPSTVNGIGTHYYGKQNVEKRHGVCESCGRDTELASYDTRLCFCVVFIPLIPLGKKRVIDDCAACRRHRVVKHAVWEEERGKAIHDAVAEYEAAPDDREKAIAMHATLASAGEREAASRMVDTLAKKFADDPEVQVYLGNSLEETGEVERSNERFHRAYKADPTSQLAQHASGVALLREGKPDESLKRFGEYEKSGAKVDPGLLFALATEFEKQNDPTAAAELLRRVGEAAPQAKKQKEFRKLAKKVEQSTGETPGALAAPVAWWENRLVWAGVAAAVVAAGLIAYDFHTAGNQRLYVVNGLPKAISVAVDDGEASLIGPGAYHAMTVPAGQHTARVVAPEELAGESAFAVEPGRLSRWFRKPVTVVDPTRSAVVLYEEATYSENPGAHDNDYELVVGEPSHTFGNADYHFVEFPNQIEIDRDEVIKSRVGLAKLTAEQLVFNFPDYYGDPAILDFLESHLVARDDREDLLGVYVGALTRQSDLQRGVDFLAKGLEADPVDVDWHRFYQRLAEQAGQRDLPAKYDALLARSPADPDLLYLRARLESYADRSKPFFERALAADPGHVMTLIGKAYSDTAIGDFGAALEELDLAIAAEPDSFRAVDARRNLLFAVDRRLELEGELREAMAEPPFNLSATEMMMASAASRGDLDLARKTQQEFAEKVAAEWPEDPHQIVLRTLLQLRRFEEHYPAAIEAASTFTDQANREAAMHVNTVLSGDITTAAEIASQLPDPSRGEAWLWTCLAATNAGDPAADEYRRNAIEAYGKSGGQLGEHGRILAGDLPGRELAQRAYLLESEPAPKAALLLLTAERVGADGGRLVELAERLSLLPDDHQPLLKAALAARKP